MNDIAQAFADPHVQERCMVTEVDHLVSGRIKLVSPPYKFSDQERWSMAPPPALGQHNEEVICGFLGYSRQDLEQLRAKGAI